MIAFVTFLLLPVVVLSYIHRPHLPPYQSSSSLSASSLQSTFDCTFSSSRPLAYTVLPAPPNLEITSDWNSTVWSSVPETSQFVDITGNASLPPRYATRAKMLSTETHLHVLALLEEPELVATITTPNEVIFHDNDIEVFVDPSGTTHNYKETEVNAYGTPWTLAINKPYSDGGYENSSRVMSPAYDMLLASPPLSTSVSLSPQNAINDPSLSPTDSWTCLISLPLQSLVVNTSTPLPTPGTFWRINFSRVEWHYAVNSTETPPQYYKDPAYPNEDNWVWSPIGVVDMHEPDKWGVLKFEGGGEGYEAYWKEWPARQTAMMVYYAQKNFYADNGEYARTVEDLQGLEPIPGALCAECWGVEPAIEVGEKYGWECEVEVGGYEAKISGDRYLTVKQVEARQAM